VINFDTIMTTVTIHLIHTIEGVEHFVELQRLVWGSDPLDIVPNHVTVTVLKNGGALLGAYVKNGPAETGGMVGAAFWWIGASKTKLKICSHMAGVLPAWQGQGIGLLLKQQQRELVLAQGLTDWITWTYDPLQRVNGVFNLHRLGAVCNHYFRNVYGVMNDALNAGTPSDRFQVDWWLRSQRTIQALTSPGNRQAGPADQWRILPTTVDAHGLLQPVAVDLRLDGEPLAVPIPPDINLIRRTDSGLALAWRLHTREVFEAAFAAGYQAVDCQLLGEHGWCYLLNYTDPQPKALSNLQL
jgi:predicted GNAT superfamily acetyltransferase